MKLSTQQLRGLIQDSYVDHNGKNLNGRCPKCGHLEFGISLEDNHVFNCYRARKCGFRGNIFTLLKFLGKSREFISERSINVDEKLELKFDEEEGERQIIIDLPEEKVPPLWRRVYEDSYLRSRGFTDEDFKKYEVGRSVLKKEYVTFLVRNSGKLLGYIGRSERSKKWIDSYNIKQKEVGGDLYRRYDNSNSDFSKMLFGYDELVQDRTTDVILVEGIFSKTKTDRNLELDSLDEMKCCATFGAKISDEQVELLLRRGVKNIWLWFEADVLEKVKKIAGKMALHFRVRVSFLDGIDPNDIGPEQALELLETAKNYLDFSVSYVKFEER